MRTQVVALVVALALLMSLSTGCGKPVKTSQPEAALTPPTELKGAGAKRQKALQKRSEDTVGVSEDKRSSN